MQGDLPQRTPPPLAVTGTRERVWLPQRARDGLDGTLAALVFLAWRTRLRWPALILAAGAIALIGFSRLYLGVHYPSDVLAGWTAALACVVGLLLILGRRAARRARRPRCRRQRGPSPLAHRNVGLHSRF